MYNPYLRAHQAPTRGRLLLLAVTLVVGLAMILTRQPSQRPDIAPLARFNLSELSLPFIPNQGQIDAEVRFQLHDLGGTLFFTGDEVVLVMPTEGNENFSTVRLQFQNSNASPEVTAGERLPGTVNFFIGKDAGSWQTNLPTYRGIVYRQLYPGIDLYYEGQNGRLKGTFQVAPGTNPGLIRWRHVGATSLYVDEVSGNLWINLANDASLIEQSPVAWQDIGGQRVPVQVQYNVAGDGNVGFILGEYNPQFPLTIDPTFDYGTFLGGDGIEDAEGIALDSAGNIYITGDTFSANFPTQNPFQGTKNSLNDVFVSKINASGDTLLYSTFLGGSDDDEGNAIAVDSGDSAYVTGITFSTNFPTQNPFQGSYGGDNGAFGDAFVTKLNANGNALVYSTYLGGNSGEEAEDITVNNAGNAFVTGLTRSSNFPTNNPVQAAYGGGFSDGFVTKFNTNGNGLVYSSFLGGTGQDSGAGIAVDSSNRAHVTGVTHSSNFPTQNPLQAYGGNGDAFALRLNANGNNLLYSTFLGGSDGESGYEIALDAAGNAYITGNTISTDFPTQNPFQSTLAGMDDVFLTQINSSGNALVYSTYLGGSAEDKGFGIAVEATGNAYVTGVTASDDFPTQDTLQAYGGNSDAFVAKFNANGNALFYSTYLGGSSADVGNDIAIDSGDAFVTGVTFSHNFPTLNPLQSSLKGPSDVFVVKIGHTGPPPSTPTPTATATSGPSPTPTATPSATPPTSANLLGSHKHASQIHSVPGEDLTYTIRLHNSGSADGMADVTDHLPPEVTYKSGSITGGGTYNSGTHTITWMNVTVPALDQVLLTYLVTTNPVTTATLITNTAVITPATQPAFQRHFTVLLTPDDTTPPVVNSLTINGQDVLTNNSVTLHISATDNQSVEWMYLQEWQINTTPIPHWVVAQSSGWVPYQTDYPWTLGNESGVHFVVAWVADSALNVSHLNRDAIDFASLLLPGETVAHHGKIPYLVYYDAGENVTATLETLSGDADLYVWYPGNFGPPSHKSINPGTATDEVTFTTPRDGIYLFLVYGYEASTFNLTITPGGGPNVPTVTTTNTPFADSEPTLSGESNKSGGIPMEPIFSQIGMDPLTVATPPGSPNFVYLPIITIQP